METTNKPQFFGEETINRVSFLRSDAEYITATISFESTHFIFYIKENNNIIPLISKKDNFDIYHRQFQQLPPHFQKLLVQWGQSNELKSLDLGKYGFSVVFLGIDENEYLSFKDTKKFNYKDKYIGVPYYAVYLNQELLTSMSFKDSEPLSVMMDYFELSNARASILSYGKMYLDWLSKYQFCPGCGSKLIPVDAGTRLLCLSDTEKNCSIKQATVSNVCFPRTDPVIITCITNKTKDKVLLGLNKRYRLKNMYTCVAGFMEPSESIEFATIREIWEETGCHATKLDIIGSQPWPFPVNLMIGCIAYVEFNNHDEIINLNHDKELQDAKWFDVEDLKKVIEGKPHDLDINLPMNKSIAFNLIHKVVYNTESF